MAVGCSKGITRAVSIRQIVQENGHSVERIEMEKDKVLWLLDKATAHRSENAVMPHINPVWKSAWISVRGDQQFAQAVVGRSQEGYHPGLFNSQPEKPL